MQTTNMRLKAVTVMLVVISGLSFHNRYSAIYCVYQKDMDTCPLKTMAVNSKVIKETGGDEYIIEAREKCEAVVDTNFCKQQVHYDVIR